MDAKPPGLRGQLRQHTRIDLPFFAWVHHQGTSIPAESCDFSIGGVHLRCRERLPVGCACRLIIELSNRHNVDLPVYCRAQVLRHTDDGMVLRLVAYEDTLGYENLRNLLLLHAPDPARALRELPGPPPA